MIIDNKYNFGDIVYLSTDEDQKPHIVTGVLVQGELISYQLSCGRITDTYFDIEITPEKDVLKKVI